MNIEAEILLNAVMERHTRREGRESARITEAEAQLAENETTIELYKHELHLAQQRVEALEKDRLDIVAQTFKAIAQHLSEPGTFRYLIYDRLGFGPDAYEPLYKAGGLVISNACTELYESCGVSINDAPEQGG